MTLLYGSRRARDRTESRAFTLHPSSRRSFTISTCPLSTAQCIGVAPVYTSHTHTNTTSFDAFGLLMLLLTR